ncbi:3-hydroxyacyl-CoA dehydrogenase [Agromyces protaetiae]|uniref:3-hydroxyacyl-CoA dehydrogenase n=1 Tax=Agromyces protaetiae TaxID=2509455 RepID=A0A4P6FR13_9MICO|nr:3-hydroxyacyl-CoA dehydrogenase [Agromyces protaetiae]QAY72968.1 3-hydroxyacyl-CoA dehydrogenase [Agromyces protaetiae]
MTALTNVTVLGTGVLGSQIAFQTAYHGHPVVAWDIDDAAIEAAKARFAKLAAVYKVEVPGAADGKADEALTRIRLSSDLADAVKDADLVIEAVPEQPQIKIDTYTKLAAVAPERTVFATNSSTLLPSMLAPATGRPDRFLALHYANRVWAMNTAEIMGTSETSPEVYEQVVEFARSTGMEPIEIKKEKAGYVLNSLLVPLLGAAGDLLVDGIADPATVDKTWRIGTGAPLGPFQIFDVVGLTTAYNVSAMGGPKQQAFAKLVKEQYLDQGKLGVATGEGFYSYR